MCNLYGKLLGFENNFGVHYNKTLTYKLHRIHCPDFISHDFVLLVRMKNSWMYKDEQFFLERKAKEMALPSIEDQANPAEKPLEVLLLILLNVNKRIFGR